MASINEITVIITKESMLVLEEKLKTFLALCDWDKQDFSMRVCEKVELDMFPNTSQYYFDDKPVFYSKYWFENNTFHYRVFDGYWRDFDGTK